MSVGWRKYQATPGPAARFGVSRSPELARIEALPRRPSIAPLTRELSDLTVELTETLRTKNGTMELWPIQAAVLRDAYEMRGALAPVGVGYGKALISMLLPSLLECDRPLLLIPPDLREQTLHRVIPEMRKHWNLHPNLRVVAYSELSIERNARMLDELRPDLIVADESQSIKNSRAGRTRRVARYMKANPETIFVPLSGTMTRKSLRDYWHLALWALKPDGCPLPVHWRELQDWADALDEGVSDETRLAPGALMRLCAPGENARDGFRRRLNETPGVIATGHTELGTSLVIRERPATLPRTIAAHLFRLRERWETPNGEPLADAVAVARHARELLAGFWYRWETPAPRRWLDARKAWAGYVRNTLGTNRRGLDTEKQVASECARGQGDVRVYRAWVAVRDSFDPVTIPVWESDYLIDDAAEWLDEDDHGITWSEHVAFGERLATISGRPYFGAGAIASRSILSATGPIVASSRAHGRGKNLQVAHGRNLFVSCPSSGADWEQTLGRTHREGQTRDEVTADLYLHDDLLRTSWTRAQADSRYIEDTTGSQQKLNYARLP